MSSPPGPGSFWLLPVFGGVLLILVGLLLFVWPELLAFVVASLFVAAGVGLIGSAGRWRANVVYRRVDDPWRRSMHPPIDSR